MMYISLFYQASQVILIDVGYTHTHTHTQTHTSNYQCLPTYFILRDVAFTTLCRSSPLAYYDNRNTLDCS